MRSIVRVMVAAGGALAVGIAQAATIASVSPQGEVAQVRQVTVRFSESVVAFGDLRLPDPLATLVTTAAVRLLTPVMATVPGASPTRSVELNPCRYKRNSSTPSQALAVAWVLVCKANC